MHFLVVLGLDPVGAFVGLHQNFKTVGLDRVGPAEKVPGRAHFPGHRNLERPGYLLEGDLHDSHPGGLRCLYQLLLLLDQLDDRLVFRRIRVRVDLYQPVEVRMVLRLVKIKVCHVVVVALDSPELEVVLKALFHVVDFAVLPLILLQVGPVDHPHSREFCHGSLPHVGSAQAHCHWVVLQTDCFKLLKSSDMRYGDRFAYIVVVHHKNSELLELRV
jgi:hypothetical protein